MTLTGDWAAENWGCVKNRGWHEQEDIPYLRHKIDSRKRWKEARTGCKSHVPTYIDPNQGPSSKIRWQSTAPHGHHQKAQSEGLTAPASKGLNSNGVRKFGRQTDSNRS
ncbi:hypothetical protein PIB30_040643 [Stylosanthes scabra]|uniref:Uncharacterized protein n=1 Tax=Stylosanthes scabra TaxID=79078 RepID=A0ABU6WFT3_9FABA|nr:hypothetical protein [Stylosanthes scabra]